MTTRRFFLLLGLSLLAFRLCHLQILWIEEAYPTAAAREILRGKVLYRDLWFDKPPLYAWVYLLWGAHTGWPLRVAGALHVLACCALAYRFAFKAWGGERPGRWAAALIGFFLTFGIPSAVMALAPDLLLVAPHLAAVYLAWRGRPFWSGLCAGLGLLVNTKALFVLASYALWAPRLPLLAGFAVPNAAVMGLLAGQGALHDYWEQVWQWGFLYSASSLYSQPWVEGFRRTVNWMGFHGAAVLGAVVALRRENWRWLAWLALCLAAVCAGWRFFPRYYFHLLPAICLAGAKGLAQARMGVLALLLLVPFLRFGPRFGTLAGDLFAGRMHTWQDLALEQDSREVARLLRASAQPGDTLLVWCYRPDVFVLSGLPAATRFLDSQPLTGVLADRHLRDARPTMPNFRRSLIETAPSLIVDGLGPANPELAPHRYPDLQPWLRPYREIARTALSRIYRRDGILKR